MASSMRDLNYYFRQPSFAGGEVSEDLWGRNDYQKYDVSVADATNMYTLPYGGIFSRAGTEFITSIGDAGIAVQMIPFQFNTEQQYMMVFTSTGLIYFFTRCGYLMDGEGDPYTIQHTLSPSDIGKVSYVQSADTMFLCSANSGIFKLERFGQSDFRWSNFVPEAGAFGEWNSTDNYLYTGTWSSEIQHGASSISVPAYSSDKSVPDEIQGHLNPGNNSSTPFGSTTVYSGSSPAGDKALACTINWNIVPYVVNARISQWTSGSSIVSYHHSAGSCRIVVQGLKTDTFGRQSWVDIWSQTKDAVGSSSNWGGDGYWDGNDARFTGSASINIPANTYTQIRLFAEFGAVPTPISGRTFYNYDRRVVNCTLSIPAWSQTQTGDDLNVICSSQSLFEPSDVGRTIMISQAVKAHEAHIDGTNTSANLPCKGDWSIIMSGSFNGTITIERSRDNGASWETFRSWSMTDLGSFEDSGTIDEYCLLRLKTNRSSDKGIVQLNVDSFIYTVYATITAYVSPTQVNVSFTNHFNKSEYGLVEAMTKQYNYALSAWSQTLGYPRCVTLYQDRLVFASSPSYPLNVWLSATGDYYNFRTEADSDSEDGAITITLTSQTMNNINNLISKNDLLGFSEGGVWKINSRSAVSGLSADTIYAQQQNFEGSKAVLPLIVNNLFLYVLDLGSTVRDLSYNYNMDSYIGDDITLLARHLFSNHEIMSWCYAQEPDSLVYMVRDDGVLITLTYVKDQEVYAFSKHTTQGLFRAVGTIRGTSISDVYFVVERSGKLYVEVAGNRLEEDTTQLCFMDCSAVYSGDEVNTISGLDFLEGYKVQVLADGSELPDVVVKDGTIKLFRPASTVRVGLGYNKTITTLDLDLPRDDGTGFARKKSVGDIKIQLKKSYGGTVKVIGDDRVFNTIDFLPQKYNEPLVLQSGVKKTSANASWLFDAKISVSSDRCVPLNVLAIMADIGIGG